MTRHLALLGLLLPGAAAAQDPAPAGEQNLWFDAHRLFLTAFDGDLRDPLLLNRPGRLTQWDWWVGGALEYDHANLVRYDVTDASGTITRTNLVDHVVALNMSAGVAFHERFRLDIAFPVYFASFDANDDYQGVNFGDIRLSALVPILIPNEDDDGVGLGVVGHFDIPSGAHQKFLGDGNVAGGGSLAFSYAVSGFTLTAEAGVHFRPSFQLGNLSGEDAFVGGIGLGYKVHETTSINLEANIEAAFENPDDPVYDGVIPALTSSPMEMTLTLRHRRPNGGHLMVGAATAVTQGAGAPRLRVFLGGGFGKITQPPPKDADLDGILDEVDACVDIPETFNGYKDEDGCPDDLANLAVSVVYDGQPIDGAEVELNQSGVEESERLVSKLEPRVREGLLPGGTYDAVARLGPCLAGDGSVTLDEGDNSLEIPLRPVRGGKVIYELVGPDGSPVKDAVATWRTDAAGCAEREGYVIGTDGRYEHPVGAGTHTVFVDAPGYRIYRENVTIAPGDVYVIRTQMKPTRVQVSKSEITILEKVYFNFNSDEIKSESFELLDEVADTILANDVGRVLVEGHTDSRGRDAYNLDLSDRRANAVRNYLLRKGVPETQLIAKGFGEARPVDTNASERGRANNRRVVFTLIDRDDQYIDVKDGGQ